MVHFNNIIITGSTQLKNYHSSGKNYSNLPEYIDQYASNVFIAKFNIGLASSSSSINIPFIKAAIKYTVAICWISLRFLIILLNQLWFLQTGSIWYNYVTD